MRTIQFSIVLVAFAFDLIAAAPSPVVKTKLGPVQGKLVQSSLATQDVYQFTAVPFAEPPLGDLRFKKPVPKKPWTNVIDATKITNFCMQVAGDGNPNSPYTKYTTSQNIPGAIESEDCLYLNVWVPRATLDSVSKGLSTEKLAVYVYIHGGSYVTGRSMWYMFNGTALAGLDNIIIVTIQYRLGVFGFGYLGKNDDAPGNAGLWDQMEAIKWVKENIEAFGGNGSRITIGGESAGAGSVGLHLISPYTRKYFNQAIVESGSGIAPWAFLQPETALKISSIVLDQLKGKCGVNITPTSTLADKLKCLRAVDAKTLVEADLYPMGTGYQSGSVPVIDGDFIPRDPHDMIYSGDVYKCPIIMGANKDEGMHLLLTWPKAPFVLPDMANPNAKLDDLTADDFRSMWESTYIFVQGRPMPQGLDPLLAELIHLHYWPNKNPGFPHGVDVLESAKEIIGDYALTCPTYVWANLTATYMQKDSGAVPPVYVYRYSEQPKIKQQFFPLWVGAMHGSELPIVFGEAFAEYGQPMEYPEDAKALSRKMIEYWGNFIKYGNPNIRDKYAACANDRRRSPDIFQSIGNYFTSLVMPPPRNVVDKCTLNTWEPYLGKDCPSQIIELNIASQVTNGNKANTCGYKARDCTFWGDFIPKFENLLKKAEKCQ